MSSFAASVLINNGDIYKPTSIKKYPLGTRGFTRDGRVYRYAKNGGTALESGKLIQAEAINSDMVAQELADSTDWAVPTTGTTLIRLSTDTSMATADFFVDGYFMVTAGTTGNEVGQMMKIESCPGTTATAGPAYAPEIFLYSEDKLVTALTTSNTVSLIKNPYDDVIVAVMNDSAITAMPVGICPTVVTASYYFWLQTWGMSCVWVHETFDAGHQVFFASDTGCSAPGVVFAPDTNSISFGCVQVGNAQYIGVDGTGGAVFLTFSP